MAKYNELKIQCLLGERLLSSFDIVVNIKTLAVLLNKKEHNIALFINRMSPTYFTRYADNNRSYGCTLKYRAPTKRAKNTLERLSYRFLVNSHLNLKKRMARADYTGFYFFEGIDNFRDVFGIDLRVLILNKWHEYDDFYYIIENKYHRFFSKLGENNQTKPSNLILHNFKRYSPYTTLKYIDAYIKLIDEYKEKNKTIAGTGEARRNERYIKDLESMIETEEIKIESFTGTFEGVSSPQDTVNDYLKSLDKVKIGLMQTTDECERDDLQEIKGELERFITSLKNRMEQFNKMVA